MTLTQAVEVFSMEAQAIGKRSVAWKSFAREFAVKFDGALSTTVTLDSVRAYMAEMRQRNLADQTILAKLLFLRQLCDLASEAGSEVNFPSRLIKTIKLNNARNRILSTKEKTALEGVMHWTDLEICHFFCFSGLRSQEAWNLRCDDCSLELNEMTIRRTKTGKGFVAEMHPWVRSFVAKAKKAGREYVLAPKGLNVANRSYLAARWKETRLRPALAIAGIKDFRCHDFRHQFATELDEAGASIVTIQRLMNHASLRTTQRYVNVRKQQLRSDLAKMKGPTQRRGRGVTGL